MIEAHDLTKEFRIPVKQPGLSGAIRHLFHGEYTTKTAVDRVNFSIEQGEAVAYIGPNGAGKSTTIKMLTGILKPTSGRVLVNGIDPQKDRIRNTKNIGVVFGQRTQLWWDIPVEESLTLLKNIYEVPDTVYQENMKLFDEIFGLGEFIGKPARRLSLGQRMRADLAAALLHNPSTIFLDEPTIGLDVGTKEAMRELIQKINRERGVTVVLTSHDLKDVEDICRRIFQALGESVVEGGVSLVVVGALAVLLTDLSEYLFPARILLFVLILTLAFLLKFCLAYLGGLLCFFTSNGFGVVYLRQVITDIFSGAMLPLSFYPLWFQKVAGVLPFQASVYLPTQVFLGRVEGRELLTTLLLQVFWVAVLWIGARFCFRLAVRKVTIQGG